jgi:hypothetical protein
MRITNNNSPAVPPSQDVQSTEAPATTTNEQVPQGGAGGAGVENAEVSWQVLRGTDQNVQGDLLQGGLELPPPALGFGVNLPLVPKQVADTATKVVKQDTAAADLEKLAKLSPGKQLEYLQQLHAKSPEKFDALVEAISAGKSKDPKVSIAVSIELASSSPWGKTDEGKAVMANVSKMFEAGKIAFGAVPGDNLGFTKPGKESDGLVGGKGTTSQMTLADRLAGTPAALASVLAHEGMHAYRYAKGTTPTSRLDSETEANLIGARVWAQLGGEKYAVTGKRSNEVAQQMKDDAAYFDLKKSPAENDRSMRLHIATEYAYSHSTSGDHARFPEGAKMIEEVLGRPDVKDILKSASDSQIKRLMSAYMTLTKDKSVSQSPNVQTYMNMLIEQMDQRNLWTK